MTSVGTRLTVEDFARLPDQPDGSRMELVDGEVHVAPPPSFDHGEIAGELHIALRSALPSGVRVIENSGFLLRRGPDVVRVPDVAVVINSSGRRRTPAGYLIGSPELVVEVVSPGDTAPDVERKVREYLAAGARRAWVVWPHLRAVTVHRPDSTSKTHESDAKLTADDLGLDTFGFDNPGFELLNRRDLPASTYLTSPRESVYCASHE